MQITNTTGLPLEGFRLLVGGLPAGVSLYNAASPWGSGIPWVDYRAPLIAGAKVTLPLTFYSPNRQTDFTPVLTISPLPATVPPANPAPAMAVERMLHLPDGSMMIEFSSIPGRLYQVQYSDDLASWQTSPASIRAGATRVQWIDRGPPDTQEPPTQSTTRYYRIQDITAADAR